MIFRNSKILSIIILLAYIFILFELGSRCLWSAKYGISFLDPREYIYHFYPYLKVAIEKDVKKNQNNYDVLLLGGSVLEDLRMSNLLKQRLSERMKDKEVRIYNDAASAHTSLDSYYKYGYLSGKHFDLVIFYEGINDLSMNNCPPKVYKKDYSHFVWYDEINQFERLNNVNFLAAPFTFYCLVTKIKEKLFPLDYMLSGTSRSRLEWLKYGKDLKSIDTYEENLSNILYIAKKKKETFLLMTFASYIPEDYTLKRFEEKLLDYDKHYCPIELWGEPENIKNGIASNNEIVRELAHNYANVIFVDQERIFPKGKEFFDDICHLTQKGYETLVNNTVEALDKNLPQ